VTVGIIDADLIGRNKHRFPNLACMKISSWYKSQGHKVDLLLDYDTIEYYDKVFISKVFTDTEVPDGILNLSWVEHGGTGFYYDKSKPLPYDIEHSMPDYHLYDDFINSQIEIALSECNDNDEIDKIYDKKRKEFEYYLDFSIGFTTRGCIRGCSFCVNKNYRMCSLHSPISEFLDPNRKYICLLDDNVLACRDWKSIFDELNATGKRFQFKQGMDERLLTDEKCEVVFNSKWLGDFIFAFDNIKDRRLIEQKLKLIRKHTNKRIKFYCFCGYNHDTPDDVSSYTNDFWAKDIADLFERIKILINYEALPYIMRYKDYKLSPYSGIYTYVAAWCNQAWCVKTMSFREFCLRKNKSSKQALTVFERDYPEIASKYFDMTWEEIVSD
jgi:hypothetical protein